MVRSIAIVDGREEGDDLNISVDLRLFPRPDRPVEGKVEGSDHKDRDGNHFIKKGMIIKAIVGLGGKAPRGPGTHEDPDGVKESPDGCHAEIHPGNPEKEGSHHEIGEGYQPDGPGGLNHIRQQLLILSLSDVDLVRPSRPLEEKREGYDDNPLTAGEGEHVAPHIEAMAHMIQVLQQVETGCRVTAHHIEHGIEVRTEMP